MKKDAKAIDKEFVDVVDADAALTIFTPHVVQPIEAGYLELSERYVEIRTRLHELVDSVKDVVVTEEYLTEATAIQKEVNVLWKEIEGARIGYHKLVDSIFYDPVAEKIEQEIKVKFQEWEKTFKASKNDIENQLLEKRTNEVADWFKKEAAEAGLDWLTLNDALNQKAVTVTRKNKSTDIVKKCNAFIDKVKSDIAVLRDGYGDEEIAEYRKTFNAATAIATVKARKAEIDEARQVTVTQDVPLVQEVVAPSEPPMHGGTMTRVWELTGTKEQLVELAKTAKKLGIEYEVLGGRVNVN